MSPGRRGVGRPAAPGLVAVAFAAAALAAAVGIVALVVVGADDDGTQTATGPAETVAVELGEFYVKPDRVEVPSGSRLVVKVTDRGELMHDLRLQGESGTDRLDPGASQTADLGVIEADTQAWCTVPGHREQGMVLTITVDGGAGEQPSGTPGG